jgi:hypothetical protein
MGQVWKGVYVVNAVIAIGPLRHEDRAAWEVLARGYKAFYRTVVPDEGYEETWQRLLSGAELHGLGAWLDGQLVGIAHYLFHVTFWSADSCYLQDLFLDETPRGQGVSVLSADPHRHMDGLQSRLHNLPLGDLMAELATCREYTLSVCSRV